VVHVGANIGEELGVYLLLGFSRVLMIEANPAAMPALKRNVAALNALAARVDGVTGLAAGFMAESVQCAVGAEHGIVTLNVMEVPTLSSIFQPSVEAQSPEASWFDVVKKAEVPMRPLDELATSLANGWSATDFNVLRLNIQGAELMALQGAARWLDHFELIFSEINLVERYAGCPRLEEIDAYLATRGFSRKWGYQWDPSGGDAAYTRS
jgi:FkbM family methyltransferase